MASLPGDAPRRYGLIIKGSAAAGPAPHAAPSRLGGGVFGLEEEGSDDDDAGGRAALAREQAAARARSAAATAALSAEGSAAVLDYDSWKDGDEAARATARSAARAAAAASGAPAAPRYIGSLLAQASERGLERDAAFERKLAREREREGAEHGPSESFVTAAYQAKLDERRARAQAQAAQDALESREDVSKRGDMSAFYRNLMGGNVAMGAARGAGEGGAAAAGGVGGGVLHAAPSAGGVLHAGPSAGGALHAGPSAGGALHAAPSAGGSLHAAPSHAAPSQAAPSHLSLPAQAAASARGDGIAAIHADLAGPARAAAEERGEGAAETRPPWARRTTDEEIEAARQRALARIAERQEEAGVADPMAGARAR